MKYFNKISLIFVIIFVVGLSIFSAQKTLAADPSCTLMASPASGAAPLNNIDLTANVTGGTGTIVYRFNCSPGDGTWDHTSSATSLTSYAIADLCDFSTAGTYTVKANVARGTAPAKDCLATVTVTSPTVTPAPTCSSSLCNLCNFANCVSAGCKWLSSSNRCIPNITPTPTPSDYVPPSGFCPGFKADYSSDGTLAEIRSDCFGTGKAYHNVDLYAPNGYPYYIALSPEHTCYKSTPPDFGEENCNNLPISLNNTSDSVVAQLFSKLFPKVKNLLGNTAEALPYGRCYSPNMVCTSFYPWQIYHAEVFTTYNSDPENCQMEIQFRNKAGQKLSDAYVYGSTSRMECGSASNTQGIGGLTVRNDEAPSAKFWEHVSLDGSMFDAVQWEGYVKYWAKRVSFKNFDIQPTTINKGDSVTISWNVLNATKVYLFVGDAWCDSKVHISSPVDPKCVAHHAGAVEVSRSGSMYLYPDSSTNFYLYAYGPSGEGPQYILNGPIKVTVNETPLSCSLNADPLTGSIPLNGVDLEATVSGSVTGNINYYFSCLNDNTWEATYLNQSAASKTATDLCSYTGAGTKNPKVKVERGGQTAECSAVVTAFDPSDRLSCNLIANPTSSPVPLTGVDLTANVSGTATGNINYYFSCLNDNTWEATYLNQSAASKTATDLCSYTGAGLKHPKARVERDGATAECSTEVSATTSSQGTIRIRTKLDGVNWTGNVGYTLNGPQTIVGTSARIDYPASIGPYTLIYTSGGPSNAMLDSISPTSAQQVLSGQTTVFTLNFKTSGPHHQECNVSKRCVTIVGEGADTCIDDVSCGWPPDDTHKECNASKRCVDVDGVGADACTDDESCGWTGDTHKECDASDKCVDVDGAGADQCINDTSCNLPDNGFVCNFSWSPESPKAKSAIDFFDYTQTPEGTTLTSWTWIFEDGTPANSSDQNPGSVIFNSAGEKTITLQATNSDNDTCTFNQEITVQSLNPKWIEVIPK